MVAAVVAVGAACGSSEESGGTNVTSAAATTTTAVDTTAETTTTLATTTTTTIAATTTTTVPPTTTTTTPPTTTTTTVPPPTTLPGEPFDPPFTPAGAELAAAAVRFDETFDLRELPGAGQPLVASLPPLATGIVSEGRARLLPDGGGIWLEVTASGTTGWTDGLLVYLSDPFDVTADVVISLGGNPTAPTMLDLADIVANDLAPSDPAAPPVELVLAAAPPGGSPSEAVYDMLPGEFFGDDSSIGSRYRIVGQEVQGANPPAFELVRAEVIALCTRGVSGGLCV